ncbi:transglycosylase domain-containing protein [Amycolatopsis endophytica]|uniref:Membrane peptidoglycan carboxypeptidase n=1 Tax=Amycolatopsis endophytica TaxID=860233 RepID=A0A853B5P0_9PSEU|nr:transglycosylase domain-containing protein [Amycolatopsis endophytica]NYI90051.1 membrane peptidoglycan carboxypeptidase [Amycolatopsis endophytica]
MEKQRRRLWWRRVRRVGYVLAGLFIGVPAIAFAVGYLVWDVRSPQEVLAELDKTVVLEYSDGAELMKVVPADGDRTFTPYAGVPRKLVDAIVAVEDPTFWTNSGFEPTGIARAMVTGVGGGSGITQQYVKNSTGEDDATLFRKFKELVLSTKITNQQSKEQIFESYVNVISFGRNTHGPAAAAQAYFGKPLRDISWSEAAFLAGMLQAPYGHDPATVGPEQAAKRWTYAADKLAERGYVSAAERDSMAYPRVLDPDETRAGRTSYSDYHIRQQVLAELETQGFPLETLRREGMTVRTTLEEKAQDRTEQAVRNRLAGEPADLRAAVVSVRPRDGGVAAYAGGNWSVTDYAVTPHRPGSAFRSVVQVAELRARADVPPVVTGAKIRQAAYDAGIPEFLDGTRTLTAADGVHIASTIAEGTYALRPIDLAAVYATFASGGQRVAPHFVAEVRKGDEVVWSRDTTPVPALPPDVARFAQGGPGAYGTSDGWTAGASPVLSTVVWVGGDDELPRTDWAGVPLTGETLPADIWREAMGADFAPTPAAAPVVR